MAEAPQIPGYRILRPLGVGGMASVYLAVQESLDREVALKVMAPALAANEEFTLRFLKEGRITAKLSHPNLVTVHDIGQHGTHYYLAAEFIPAGTLRDRLNEGGVAAAEALDVTRDVAHGLHYAHEKGFVHRDVKPGNILFRQNGTAVLADFGIAKAMGSGTMATQAGSSIGTPHYMSPEQARAETVDGRSDLYSLGAVLFEMLTGRPPYDAPDPFTIALMHVTHAVPTLPAEHAWLQPLIEGSMAKHADDRYANGDAFVAAIDKLLASAPEAATLQAMPAARRRVAPRRAAPMPQPGRGAAGAAPMRRASDAGSPTMRYVLIGAGAAVLVGAAIGGWLLFGRSQPPATDVAVAPSPMPSQVVPQPMATDTPAATPAPTAPPVTDLTATTAQPTDVAGLLARAREYVKIGVTENGRRLAAPEGDSAIDLYRRVLEVDPANAEARAGLGQVAAFYESKAKAAFDRGFFSGSMVLAETGLRADPDSAALKQLLEESKKAAGL